MKPLLHPQTAQAISLFIDQPAQTLILSGPIGSGKGLTANYLAKLVLDLPNESLDNYPYAKWFHDQDKGVSIDNIREAQSFMQLRVPGSKAFRRVLIVEQGETMSLEAQNAFLKLLEEPPSDSLIIITCTNANRLLPTIHSRAQHLQILPPSQQAVTEYFSADYTPSAITKAYYMSEGYMGLMTALLEQNTNHPLVESIETAKTLLAGSSYQRLAKVDHLAKQKNIDILLQAMELVSHAALSQSIAKNGSASKRWAARLKAIVYAQQAFQHNAQAKLLLTDLMLSL